MEAKHPVFAKIIGPQKQGNTALKDCYQRLKKNLPNFIEDKNDISFDCHIYLIAHGKSSLHNLKAGIEYNEKTSKDIVDIIKILLFHLKQVTTFKGKIILEMCHSAEPMVNKDTMLKCLEIQNSRVTDYYDHYCKLNIVIGSSSLLAEVQEGLKADGTLKESIDNTAKLGGYLGLSMDGDFTKSGYSVSSTQNPLTEKFQYSRGYQGVKKSTGVEYNELQSYLEINFSQKLPYGKK